MSVISLRGVPIPLKNLLCGTVSILYNIIIQFYFIASSEITQGKDSVFSLVKNNMVMLFSLLVSGYFSCLHYFPNRC